MSQEQWQRIWRECLNDRWGHRDEDSRCRRLGGSRLEEPQKHACQHVRQTSRGHQLTSRSQSRTLTPTGTSEAPIVHPPRFSTLHTAPNGQMGGKGEEGKEGGGGVKLAPCPLPAWVTIHTLSSWQASLIWIQFSRKSSLIYGTNFSAKDFLAIHSSESRLLRDWMTFLHFFSVITHTLLSYTHHHNRLGCFTSESVTISDYKLPEIC